MQKVITKFEIKGTVLNNCRCGLNNLEVEKRARRREPDTDLDVLLHVEECKGIHTRTLGKSVGLDQSTVLRTVKKYKYQSYNYKRHQELREG